MRIVAWVLQVLLAAMFLWHGLFMLNPPAEFVGLLNEQLGIGFRTFLGTAEVLGGIGMILPALTRILPWLTILAAAGIMVVMVSATVLHFSRGETSSAITTIILFVMAAAVVYLRWKVVPIVPRSTPAFAA